MKTKSNFITLTIAALSFIVLPLFATYGQSIDAKLGGNTTSQFFKISDNNGTTLMKMFGDGRMAIGMDIPGAELLHISAPTNMNGMGVESNGADIVTFYGVNNAPDGNAIGIMGESKSTHGYGIYGVCTEWTGVSGSGRIGVAGGSYTAYGKGVYGRCDVATGFGVDGVNYANSTTAVAVRGTSKQGIAVYGETTEGLGVYGLNTASSGNTVGVLGEASSTSGIGVKGESQVGVYGRGYYGVRGFATDANGIGVSGYGYSGGWAGFFDGKGYFSGRVGIKTITPSYDLHVNGTAGKTGGGSWSNASDIRLKDLNGPYTKGLDEIVQLRPIRFHYRKNNSKGLPSEPAEIGFVAQDVQKVFPEAVSTADDGYLDLNLHSVNVAMVNAVRELRDMIRNQNEVIERQNQRIQQLEARIRGGRHMANAAHKESE